MFEKNYELRYSDTDFCGNVKKSAIIDLLQDISIIHSNSVGLDKNKFAQGQLACLLSGWRICFKKPLVLYETVTVKTGIMKITGCEIYRRYEIWQNGQLKVAATGLWFTVNTETMRIARIGEDFFGAFGNDFEYDNNLPCKRLSPVENAVFIGEAIVEKRDLDTNRHMNNVKSIDVFLSHMPDDFDFSEIQVKYRKELKAGDNFKIYANMEKGGFEIRNSTQDICVLIYVKNQSENNV